MKTVVAIALVLCLLSCTKAQVLVGASQFDRYEHLLAGKNVGLVVNQTSIVEDTHLVDFLISKEIDVKKVFAPEHGFRGEADAGEHVKNDSDLKTGLPIISLYGKNKKPSSEQLQKLDIIVFDIQDVGARFYTYISTMHYVMEAAAEQKIPLVLLDRPNPNGHYVAGPVLDTNFRSFVGMHPIPIVHGLTMGELADMINQEGWLNNKIKCETYIINCKNYTHDTKYTLPIKPSPNLPNNQAIALYPSLCLFEGTNISIGRGTTRPFQLIGAPQYKATYTYSFVPKTTDGAKNPKFKNEVCFGIDLSSKQAPQFSLKYLLEFYKKTVDKENFFKYSEFFNKLAGTDQLMKKMKEGKTSKEIEKSWAPQLEEYLTLRRKYLHYPDFTE